MNILKSNFRDYLINKGYSLRTPSGKPSTVYDYCKRIDYVCGIERITWENVKTNIDKLFIEYSKSGIKSKFGAKSHNAVISALSRFKEAIFEGKL